ncbi:CehA/McbA family metallohydrolase [Catalinimonas niigatensis]|uniref:CehA/McbA family metallohydrolase n=1 Tax=Catalinimonas niigatensis TaxID=1397264 RepID=UPI00266642C2|nr:CehA/McbA family metallohydrolase [Catalinimonas niigatensis]WPP50432.1 CehA/McbA family metallohydrolase [Catalinimonas niigatensis]
MKSYYCLCFLLLMVLSASAQHQHQEVSSQLPLIEKVEAQPLLAQALRVSEALSFIGSALPAEDMKLLQALQQSAYDETTIRKVQEILDPYCLAMVDINPESRVKVSRGPAEAQLMQEGWTTFLVKVNNQANITAKLLPESPNAEPVLHISSNAPRMKEKHRLTAGQLDNRFLQLAMYHDRPLQPSLSGLGLEYAVIQIYTREKGKKEAKFGFNVGQGTQDIGFRNTIDILFDIQPAVKVVFEVKDEDGTSAMASFIITDGVERFGNSEAKAYFPEEYRLTMARSRHWEEPRSEASAEVFPVEKKLRGIYPLPARRLAGKDTYPDFFFQPQVYRADGEYVYLPPGEYKVNYGRGPEYLSQEKQITIPEGVDSFTVSFPLKRWIHMAELDWYSADHHIHAAGCSHYESPEEGVLPEHMWRQVRGEDLNLGSNLSWGPSWYFQKQFFTGEDHPLSDRQNLLRYDVEVSGFPSSHAGHLVLLNLQEDDYPNTTTIEEWPTFTLPVLQWAKAQGGVTGYAHSGWGLTPVTPTAELPNYVMPKMDGIGANEYVVTVTHDVVDFYSAGDTPAPAELNMWYHTLNSGFRTRISGETDFPCISDERVGRARIYAKLEEGLSFANYMDAIQAGRSYVSDGYAHLINFKVNGVELGMQNSELKVEANTKLNIQLSAAAFLEEEQNEVGAVIAAKNLYQSPYWHIERSRIGTSRNVSVELIVNGRAVETKEIEADGNWQELAFTHTLDKSAWVAIRIFPTAHTNPIFVLVDGNPIREKKSAQWCRDAVDQCWEMKSTMFKDSDMEAAKEAYDHARAVYDRIIQEE